MDVLDRGAVGQEAGGIDGGGGAGPLLAPAADGVVIFQHEADGIDAAMATGAGGGLGVGGEQFAWCGAAVGVGGEGGHVLWRRWRWHAEDVFQHPHAANDGLGIDAIGGGHHDGGLAEKTAVTVVPVDFDFPELDPLFAVEFVSEFLREGGSETVVALHEGDGGKGEIGIDEVGHRQVLEEHFQDEALGFLFGHGGAGFVEVELRIRHDALQGGSIEPLADEALDHGIGDLGGKEALGLAAEDPVGVEAVALREVGQFVVGWPLSQEVR